MPLSLAHQARALRSLTGLPLARCRKALLSAAPIRRRARAKQMELEEAPLPEEEVTQAFADLRRRLRGNVKLPEPEGAK